MYSESDLQQAMYQLDQVLSSLREAHYSSWVENFRNMIDFCHTNPTILAILKKHTKSGSGAAANQWFKDWENSGPRSRRKIKPIPYDDDGFGMNIKILERFFKQEIGMREFCDDTFPGSGRGERYAVFYSELIQPFTDFIRVAINRPQEDLKSRKIRKDRQTERAMRLAILIGIAAGVLGAIATWLALCRK